MTNSNVAAAVAAFNDSTSQDRTPRELDTREYFERPTSWRQPELLPEPIKMEGFAYKWMAVSVRDELQPRTYSSGRREGWEPVPMEEQPHMRLLRDISRNTEFKNNIEIGGLLLCKIPSEFVSQRRKFYLDKTNAQTDAVNSNYMKDNDPRMSKFTSVRSKVRTGEGATEN